MKRIHQKDDAQDELEDLVQINVLLLRLSGLLAIGCGWRSQLVGIILLLFSHLCHLFLSIMYVLNITMGYYDAATISECVFIICLHWRYLILYRQRKKLEELLRACRDLWVQLTISEKDIVR